MLRSKENYKIFHTSWGWVSIGIDSQGVKFLILPEKNKEDVLFETEKIGKMMSQIGDNKSCRDLEKEIVNYFEGTKVDFSKYPLNLSGYSMFQKKVLLIVQKIPYGKTMSYKQVAEIAGYPGAYRAVGTTMKLNNIPLIIPCHRVIKSNGSLGGFSANGGTGLKERMLILESNQ